MLKAQKESIRQWPTLNDIEYLFDKAMDYQKSAHKHKEQEYFEMYRNYLSCYFSCINMLYSMTIDDIADQFCMITIFMFDNKEFWERYDLAIETYNKLIKKSNVNQLHKVIDWIKYGNAKS